MDIQNTKKIILKKPEFFINWSMYITFVSKIEKPFIKEKRNKVIIIKNNLFLGDSIILVSDNSPIKKIKIAYSK